MEGVVGRITSVLSLRRMNPTSIEGTVSENVVAIRRMTSDDIAAIGGILAASPEAAQWNLREFANPAWPPMTIWVAAQKQEVVGVVAARVVSDEAEILNLAIVPAWRRQGIGQQLVDTAINAARAEGVQSVFLEVRESNGAARAFYAGLEFTQVGRRRSYYREPTEDALVLSRALAT
jgi:ribosomal-protein-alanine acetyltransferase